MSTVKERLRAVEVEIKGLQKEVTEFKTFCGKKFDDMADIIKNNPKTKLSGRDKISVVVSLIMSIGSIIAAIIMTMR